MLAIKGDSQLGSLTLFYRNEGCDTEGRWLRDIRHFDIEALETTHNYIQWLFPTRTKSQFNADAPVLTEADIYAFRRDPQMRLELIRSFSQMLGFLGLVLKTTSKGLTIEQSQSWAERSTIWLSPGNHNHRRITRILESLATLGQVEHATAFFAALEKIYARHADCIGEQTLKCWSRAALKKPV